MKTFDWNSYFLNHGSDCINTKNASHILQHIRKYLCEDNIKIAFALTRMMRKLMEGILIPQGVKLLELGAATGFLARWFINEYETKATLVDNNQSSYEAFLKNNYNADNIDYILEDIFNLKSDTQFDIVCSFGLIEHFADKNDIINTHIKFLKPNGYLVILVPKKSFLTQIYFDIHPELNCGYRELLTEQQLIDIMQKYNLTVLNHASSDKYVYDFVGVICKLIK